MANCKDCKREIPDGTDYCVSCKEKRDHSGKYKFKIVACFAVIGVAILGLIKKN